MKLNDVLAVVFFLAFSATAHAQPRTIEIASFGEHPALRQVADGFKQRMSELGYVEGKEVDFGYQHANFDRTLIPQMLRQVEAKHPTLIFAITTPINQAAIRGINDKSVPIVFGSVVDPVVAGIVPDWQHGSAWSSGATLLPNFDASFDFLRKVVPTVKKVGTLFNPGEDNDNSNMELMRKSAKKVGIEIVAVPVDNANEIAQRVQSLGGQVDVIFQIQSNIVQTSMPVVVQTALRAKLPLFNSVYLPDLKNQIAGFHAISYVKNGRHAADIADRILKGEKPTSIPSYVPQESDFDSIVSATGFEAAGLKLPEALKDSPWVLK